MKKGTHQPHRYNLARLKRFLQQHGPTRGEILFLVRVVWDYLRDE